MTSTVSTREAPAGSMGNSRPVGEIAMALARLAAARGTSTGNV
jgi:hypothetical protein